MSKELTVERQDGNAFRVSCGGSDFVLVVLEECDAETFQDILYSLVKGVLERENRE